MLEASEAVAHIKSQTGDPARFRQRPRGYVDWKFGELCEYLGYDRAGEYVRRMMEMWWDYELKYGDCLLVQTYKEFQKAM
jgi:hypothetical protein